jgi:flagellar hook-basal body complex protein FliE
MPALIPPIQSLRPEAAELLAASPAHRPAQASASAGGFGAALSQAIEGVETIQDQGAQAVGKFLSGENQELHSTLLAAQRAELSFDLFLQVRNKIVAAYQEIMRMQE